ncbi:hypothetical protein [Mesomycoplasma neurolyticum]|uniref:Uncharacterized protein n=1 Tax=Mesomycoplasma neurolyticum TaxID=2120 RepID=A0A449A5K6_9BACT|nr:hypothetical protein [Mesomycoplasma neurolyticum]VEU59433.1 Uncharacterised protein [Mesomycoplasma neurolyticum]
MNKKNNILKQKRKMAFLILGSVATIAIIATAIAVPLSKGKKTKITNEDKKTEKEPTQKDIKLKTLQIVEKENKEIEIKATFENVDDNTEAKIELKDEENQVYSSSEKIIIQNNQLLIDTNFLTFGKKYTITSIKILDSKNTNNDLNLDLSKISTEEKIVDKTASIKNNQIILDNNDLIKNDKTEITFSFVTTKENIQNKKIDIKKTIDKNDAIDIPTIDEIKNHENTLGFIWKLKSFSMNNKTYNVNEKENKPLDLSKITLGDITQEATQNSSSSNNEEQKATISIDLSFESKITIEQMKKNKFTLQYVNETNSKDISKNEQQPEIIEKDGKQQLKFEISFKQSNRKYKLDKLIINDFAEFSKENEFKTKESKTEIATLSLNATDVDEIAFSAEINSEDAPFTLGQKYVVIYKDVETNTEKTSDAVTLEQVQNPLEDDNKQNKKAILKGKISNLKENKEYEIVGIKAVEKNTTNNTEEPHYSDFIANNNYASKNFDFNDSITNKKAKTLDSSKTQIRKVRSIDTNGTEAEFFEKTSSFKMEVEFENIFKKWKNHTIVLKYKSSFNDDDGSVLFAANITDETQKGKINFEKVQDSEFKGNRIYKFEKFYLVKTPEALNTTSLTKTDNEGNLPIEEKNKNTFKTNPTDGKNALRIVRADRRNAERNLTIDYFSVIIDDKDNILSKGENLRIGIALEKKNKNRDINYPDLDSWDNNKIEINSQNEKFIKRTVLGIKFNDGDNYIHDIIASKTNKKIAKNLWGKNDEISIKHDYTNNNKRIFVGNKIKFVNKKYDWIQSIDENGKVNAEIELEMLYDETNQHMKENTYLGKSVKFRAEMVQSAPSYNHPKENPNSQSDNVKIIEPTVLEVKNGKLKIKFTDLVSNRKYSNLRIYAMSEYNKNNIKEFKNSNTKSITIDRLLNNLPNILDLKTTPRETTVELVSKNTKNENNKQMLEIKYKINSLDETLTNQLLKLKLTSKDNNTSFSTSQEKNITKEGDNYIVTFEFEMIENNNNNNIENKNNKILKNIDYSVELTVASAVDWAFDQNVKVKGINQERNRTLINNDSEHDDSNIKTINLSNMN